MMRSQQDEYSKIFYELSAMVLNIMRSPPLPIEVSGDNSRRRVMAAPSLEQITPAGFASLMLGVSLALMLCGSVTFFIGFLLMPWVLGLVMFLYFVAVVSSISMIGKTIFGHSCSASHDPHSPRKVVPSWKLL